MYTLRTVSNHETGNQNLGETILGLTGITKRRTLERSIGTLLVRNTWQIWIRNRMKTQNPLFVLSLGNKCILFMRINSPILLALQGTLLSVLTTQTGLEERLGKQKTGG